MRPVLAIKGGKKTFFSLLGPINAGKIVINTENILGLKIVGATGPFSIQGLLWLCDAVLDSHRHPQSGRMATAPQLGRCI